MRRPSSSPPRFAAVGGRLACIGALAMAGLGGGAGPAGAQQPGGGDRASEGWNAAGVVELVRRAVDRRALPLGDSLRGGYEARAEGHIHFLADRMDGLPPIPLRVDQVALDLSWSPPDQTRQVIRGLRSEELLPIRDFRYYRDRLTVVQNGFGDVIRVGEGMDVGAVLHPLSRLGPLTYEYAAGDTLRLVLPGVEDPVEVVRVRVRPFDPSTPGFVGTVDLEPRTGALVALEFTFTPSSYTDRRIDRVHISLEHALWEGRHWLPYRQRVEVRREIPELDIRVQSVIQGVLTVEEYRFDPEFPPGAFEGPPVVIAADARGPEGAARFRGGLFDELDAAGLRPAELAEIEAEARRLVREQVLGGLPRTRLHWDRISALVRANRSDGVRIGVGLSRALGTEGKATLRGGFGSGSRRGDGALLLRLPAPDGWRIEAEARVHSLEDLGPVPVRDPVSNSLVLLAGGEDRIDPWRADGLRLSGTRPLGERGWLRMGAALERHRRADRAWSESPWLGGRGLAPVPEIEEGILQAVEVATGGGWTAPWPGGRVEGEVALRAGTFEGEPLARISGRVAGEGSSRDRTRSVRWSVDAGGQSGALPLQQRFFLGGGETLPGHPHRGWNGDAFALLRVEGEVDLLRRWVSLRVLGAAGGVSGPSGGAGGAGGAAGGGASLGLGLGLVRGIGRIDHAWGLGGGGRGAWVLSIHPGFRSWL